MKRSIPEASRDSISKSQRARKFLEEIEQFFAKNENVETSNLLAKLISMMYKGKGNIREYIMEMSNLSSKLKSLKLDLGEDLLVHLVFISVLAHLGQFKQKKPKKDEEFTCYFYKKSRHMKKQCPKYIAWRSLWGETLKTTVYIFNRVPSKAINKTPYELWTEQDYDEVLPQTPIEQSQQPQEMSLKRSIRERRHAIVDDYIVFLQEHKDDIGLTKDDPINFCQAMCSSNSQKWIDAIKDEIKSMQDNDVWDLVELLEGVKAIGCK
ncbi:hypothetical protein CR513_00157, partial [Mucuna pruriens]